MGDGSFEVSIGTKDLNCTDHGYTDDTFFMNMENGTTIKMNGMNGHLGNGSGGGYTFANGSDNIKALSNSKMSLQSLQSLRSNSSGISNNKIQLNGHASQLPANFEEREVFIVVDSGDRKFGFSVVGGVDEGFAPRVDEISAGSPAERCGLCLDDEIISVNNLNVERASHIEIIMQIHKSKKNIVLTVRRPRNQENGAVHENPIDVPSSYRTKTVGEPSSGKSNVDGASYGMFKFRSQPKATAPLRDSNVPSKFVNPAYEKDVDDEFGSVERLDQPDTDRPKSLVLSNFVTMLELMKGKLKNGKQQNDLKIVQQLLNTPRFKSAIKTHNRMTRIQVEKKTMENHQPVATNSQFLLSEVGVLLMEHADPTTSALEDIINKPQFKELLRAHDQIAKRECLNVFPEIETSGGGGDDSDLGDMDDYMGAADEQQVKIVRIDKTNEPLGATVCNEGDAVIISRIIKGGAAEKSGLLHEGDEILEINNNSVRGKDVNEVVELLSELEGTLTFVLVPGMDHHKDTLRHDDIIVMKALFDYDPTTDDYIPCEELGLSFMKGDVIEILNQNDPDWWQARFLDEKHNSLAGLVPSKQFQLQRELAKISLKGDDNEPIIKEKKKCFCGRARRKGKKVPMNSRSAPIQENEILTYEDMVRIFPDPRRKRPVVLVGAPRVGRREIRERLTSQFSARFSAIVPHTTRPLKPGEVDGEDYNFVTNASFQKSIAAAEFIEHGHLEGHYYGTSFSAVRSVINSGKVCLLNMHCQALPVLKSSNLLPYVIFVTVPRLSELNRLREFDDSCEPFNPNVRLKKHELDDLLEKARSMNRTYGHFFDKVIVNNDLDQAFEEVLRTCNHLEKDPQWVPSSWVR